ncbi:hypothetical protein EUGRSUZ_H02010 [Eucalyptus grandis]|uniref:Uncharacterized protein n=2 Tax=Eucalyptus grandis TaxID=71139 RepID=A0ACC3JSI6_EUCGR|nr:hypothetical protein EUGRSUZ_H02010 [Eucalyptus grandis]
MHNSDPHNNNHHHHHHHHHLVGPRISFSNDFVESQCAARQERRSAAAGEAPASSDFEFSVSSYSMMSADELFSKGKLLPFKEKPPAGKGTTTLREELLAGDDDSGCSASRRPPKGSGRWKGFLGLRKSHIGSRKADKSCEASCDGSKRTAGFGVVPDSMHYHGKTAQEMTSEGGSNGCMDEEMEM